MLSTLKLDNQIVVSCLESFILNQSDRNPRFGKVYARKKKRDSGMLWAQEGSGTE